MHHRSSSSSSFGASVDGPASSTSSAHKSSSTLMIPKSMSAGNCALATVSCAAVGGGGGVTVRGSPSQYVKLNVGGSLYYTTIGTLTKHDNMLRAMFSGRMEVLTDAEGQFFTGDVFLSSYALLTLDCCRLDYDRPVWEALRDHPQLFAGRLRLLAGDQVRSGVYEPQRKYSISIFFLHSAESCPSFRWKPSTSA